MCFVDVGVEWLVVQLTSGDVVRTLEPDLTTMVRRRADVTVFGREPTDDPWVRVRSFAPGRVHVRVDEDGAVHVGGRSVVVAEGHLLLP